MRMNVTLTPNELASRRTRNRIREHGPVFRAESSKGLVWHDGIRLCWLVRAEDGWLGWLPRSEFNASGIGAGSLGTRVLTHAERMER